MSRPLLRSPFPNSSPFMCSPLTHSEDATNELRVKTVKYFKSIEKVQDEVEAKYGPVASVRLGLGRASAA